MPEQAEAARKGKGEQGLQHVQRVSSRVLGQEGERAAAAFLQRRGFRILETNWRCPVGEVDIIAQDDDALHFVEVKTRRGVKWGFPAEAVTPEKRERYRQMARLYVRDYGDGDTVVRFDVASVLVTGEGRACLHLVQDAFGWM